MWDTVAWNYRLHRRPPEFTFRKVNVVVRDGVVHVNNGGEVSEVLDGDDSIGGVRVIVSRKNHIMFFIVGRTRRGKLSSYTAGVSCHDQLVTTDIMQVAINWTKKKATLSDDTQIDNVRADNTVRGPQSIGISSERVISERASQQPRNSRAVYNIHIDQTNTGIEFPAPWSEPAINIPTTVFDGHEASEEARRDEIPEEVTDVHSV